MKRFLLIMTAIFALMLITTACVAEDSIQMEFDEHTIKMIAKEDYTVILDITIQFGDKQEEFSKQVELQETTTTMLNVEELIFEEFSDFYKDTEAKIVNVHIDRSRSQSTENRKDEKTFIMAVLTLVVCLTGGLILKKSSLNLVHLAIGVIVIVLVITVINVIIWTLV